MASEVKCELKVNGNDERKGFFMLSLSCDGSFDRGVFIKASPSGSEIDIPLTSTEAVEVAKAISEQYSSYLERMIESDERKMSGLKDDITNLPGDGGTEGKSDESD